MSLNSGDFLLFFLIAWLLLFFMRDAWRPVLLFLSYAFYCSWNWQFLPLLMLVTIADYFCARKISVSSEKRRRKAYLYLSLSVNLALLVYFKYAFNLANAAAAWLGSAAHWMLPLIPIGLSFHTFQSMGYVLDVYRGKSEAEKSILNYANFVSFFPQLIAGPIERATHLLPQLSRKRISLSADQIYRGAYYILMGLTLTLGLGEVIAPYGLPVQQTVQANALAFAHFPAQSDVLISFYVFPFTLYLRFAGYSFLAMGFALLLGIELSVNFKFPFFSRSMAEFWSRWHISLSKWIRDYIFFPLSSRARTNGTLYGLIFFTTILFGLWHQASLGWLVASLTLGGYSIAGHVFISVHSRRGRVSSLFHALLTFHVFALAMFFVNNLSLGQSLSEFGLALARMRELPFFTTMEWYHVRIPMALAVTLLIDGINFAKNDVLGILQLKMPFRIAMVSFLVLFLFFNRAPESGLSMYFRM